MSSTHSEGMVESSACLSRGTPMPRLQTAKCENVEINKEYKSGATYQGSIADNRRVGRGIFVWPNGASYEGKFLDNMRHGIGTQKWPDGSCYSGDFTEDLRHGDGEHTWASGESYRGRFYKDRRHGKGTYTWSDGSTYSGCFYVDKREGYGVFSFPDGRTFQGLYGSGERLGPGVMTYPDGRQDVGLWLRDHLAKLCVSVEESFSMANHPEFDFIPEEHQMTLELEPESNRSDVIAGILNPPEPFDYHPGLDLASCSREIFKHNLHEDSLAVDVETFQGDADKGYVRETSDVSGAESQSHPGTAAVDASSVHSRGSSAHSQPRRSAGTISDRGSHKSNAPRANVVSQSRPAVVAWNKTPSSVRMQKHVMKHARGQDAAGFDVSKLLELDRTGFGSPGDHEAAALALLVAAGEGDARAVGDCLHGGKAFVDVADSSGHTPLLAAAVNWHHDVINCLLDNGADVNKLNDEGVSALAACHVFFYPVDCFRYNIAERYLDRPPDFQEEAGYDVSEVVKGILTNAMTQKKKSSPTLDRKHLLTKKKISELREEYALLAEKCAGGEEGEGLYNAGRDAALPSGRHSNASVAMTPVESVDGDSNEERTLGRLQVKRTVRINLEEELAVEPEPNSPFSRHGDRHSISDDVSSARDETSDLESTASLRDFAIEVTDAMIDRCATQLSTMEQVVSRERSALTDNSTAGTVRRLAMDKARHALMESTIRLLLLRGADPNAASVPMPVLFFAVKAADVEAVRVLLARGASTSARLSQQKGRLAPLHIAAALPGDEGVAIARLLLDALADPDVRAAEDDCFLNRGLEEEWRRDVIDPASEALLGGRTPLHIACARDDNYRNACRVVHLLLDHHANPNLLCNGHSPLTLAITSGNDYAIEELLCYGADPSLTLTHGVGSALCVAASTEYEHRRNPDVRIQLIDRLVNAGADILAPIPIGIKRTIGTSLDYGYYMYNLDRRIAHMPYHALTPAERETFNARRRLLGHLGDILRTKATERERRRMEEEERAGERGRSPSPNFVYTGAGSPVPPGGKRGARRRGQDGGPVRKPLFRYCYECGRSVGVRLSACTRCKEVFYCSKACKLKAWNSRHKDECLRLGGGSPSPRGKDKRVDSPTPATDPDRGKPTTVPGLLANNTRIKVPWKGRSLSARKLAVDQANGKTIYKENYSFV